MRRQAPVIGITGNIGSGKSTVAGMLAALGASVIDADHVVHELYAERNGSLTRAVAAAFGEGIVTSDGAIDRAALGSVVIGNNQALRKLERLVHPVVVARIEQELGRIPQDTPIAIEAIKLIESDLVTLLDTVWIVTTTPESQLARLQAKGMPCADARRRIEIQSPIAEKLAELRQKRGDFFPVLTIDNATTRANLRGNVGDAWRAARELLHTTKEN